MIRLPVFTHLTVSNYALFPGESPGDGLSWEFQPGVTLIAGVNGLGKTTLLTVLLRAHTGPYDLTGDGPPDTLESVLPEHPVPLNSRTLRFFEQRVADRAHTATVKATTSFGSDVVTLERQLGDLNLVSLSVNDAVMDLPARKQERELMFQRTIQQLCGLSSFVDVLLVLHHVVFFLENRPGALWDENAQRQLLRALFLDKELAAKVAEFERKVQSADSRARNISARAFGIQRELDEAKRREAVSPKLQAELAVEQQLLEADLHRRQSLEAKLNELDEARKATRLDHERAKVEREEAETQVERLKYTVLLRLFPTMEDAARLVVLRLLTKDECLVCGAKATGRRAELERLLGRGCCPACGAEPEQQAKVVAPHKVEEARLERARARAEQARAEEEGAHRTLLTLVASYDAALTELGHIRKGIEERRIREKRLTAELPSPSVTVVDLERMLAATRRSQHEAEAESAAAARELRVLMQGGEASIRRNSRRLAIRFGSNVSALLGERSRLAPIQAAPKLTQSKMDFAVPAFLPDMTAATRPGLIRRSSPIDVSESQRELVDLAFRLALIAVATGGKPCSFVMETPEASLDELAMERVGFSLHDFAAAGNNRLIVTNNLTNSGMITSLFGGPSRNKAEITRRQRRVVNLLRLAAPNRAVEQDRERYEAILNASIGGDR